VLGLLGHLGLLHVVRNDQARRRLRGDRRAHGVVECGQRLLRREDGLHVLAADILEQRVQVHFLEVAAAQRGGHDLADDRHDGPPVEFGVVEPGEQVDGTRPLGGHTHADLAGVLGVPAGGERRQLLVAGGDEVRAVGPLHGAQQRVDAVAGVSEDSCDVPLAEAFDEGVGDELGRGVGVGHAPGLPGMASSNPRRSGGPATFRRSGCG
jgi:hypothetical protein